jgi:hypothetical protein
MNRSFLCCLVLIISLQLQAQQGNSYINLYYNPSTFSGTTYQGLEQVSYQGKNFPIGLQQIINQSNYHAWRIGVTFLKQQLSGHFSSLQNGTDNEISYRIYPIFSPSFQVGHEVQLRLYKHNMVYAGVEASTGIMHNSYKQVTQYESLTKSEIRSSADGFFWNTHVSGAFVAGVRCHIASFILGYETALCNRYTTVLGAPIAMYEPWLLQHRISLGYIRGYKKETCHSTGCRY